MFYPNEPSLASHFWNWVLDYEVGNQSIIFTKEYFGATDPNEEVVDPEIGLRIVDGPFTVENFPIRLDPTESHVGRSFKKMPWLLGPTPAEQKVIVCFEGEHDAYPWQSATAGSFRDALEGFSELSKFHNGVHAFVAGDMLPFTSPNDPLFWEHHTNIDRLFCA